ncbi:MAG: hypothetical protein WCY89_02710 [Flavobacteriaceae bacterium]
MKHELQSILSGKSEVRFGAAIQAISRYLRESPQTSTTAKSSKHYKKQETEIIKQYISENNLWISDIDFSQYISEGAEQKVYLKDKRHVIKLNDAIYYNSWEDYLYNLLLHNYFFPDTAYELLGFTKDDKGVLYAVVKQAFVTISQTTNLQYVKDFLIRNHFSNIRNNDYINTEIGIILEDLHDENVLTQNGVLYFIDTVFYLTENFWEKE